MSPYTVVLVLPDYIAHNYGEEHFIWQGSAASYDAALQQARGDAAEEYRRAFDPDPADFLGVIVLEGTPVYHLPD